MLEIGSQQQPPAVYGMEYLQQIDDLYNIALFLQKKGKLNTKADSEFIKSLRSMQGSMVNHLALTENNPVKRIEYLKKLQSLGYEQRSLTGKTFTSINDDIAEASADSSYQDFAKILKQDNNLNEATPFWILNSVKEQYDFLVRNMTSKYVDVEYRLYALQRSNVLQNLMKKNNAEYAKHISASS